MIKVNLQGNSKEFEAGITAAEVAKSIGAGLYKAAVAAKIDGELVDLRTPLQKDCQLDIVTFNEDDNASMRPFWHTASHILAQAVQHLFPTAKFAIGPSIEDGFYYDFDVEKPFTAEDLEKLEAEMKKIAKEDLPLERREVPAEEARKIFKDQPYKLELLEEHAAKGELISIYVQGDFTDLCAGPHLMSTGAVKAAKLTSATAAYWRGDSKNKTLCRVYGIAFPKASMLEAYLTRQAEALKRDHNKLGRELEYFTTVDVVGQGLPIILPNGTYAIQSMQRWIEDVEDERGYVRTKTPLMAKRDLYKISGHWDHYLDGMFILGDPYDEEKECFALRPMTCPFQYQAYLNRKRSYRDLPMRLGETSTLFRNEDSGEMHGLTRVRQFTISEGHLVVRPDQLEEEFKGCLDLARYTLKTLGLDDDVSYRFSQWDPENKGNKYEGTAEQWNHAQAAMAKILDDLEVKYTVGIDEAAFYGPKLDIQLKNVYGKEDTLITIQIDMLLAEKFGMYYTGEDGQDHLPYIIHRTSMGCYERTLAALIEKYAGALPTWLMNHQVEIIPITDRSHAYAYELDEKLKAAHIRSHVDDRSEKLGYKLRDARMKRIPYRLVLGDKEMQDGTVSVQARLPERCGTMTPEAFITMICKEIDEKEHYIVEAAEAAEKK